MKRLVALFAAAILTAALPVAADAQGRGKGNRPDRQEQRGGLDAPRERLIPLSQLIPMMERATGGEHLTSDGPIMRGGRPMYMIKLKLPGGQIRPYWVDAVTGQF